MSNSKAILRKTEIFKKVKKFFDETVDESEGFEFNEWMQMTMNERNKKKVQTDEDIREAQVPCKGLTTYLTQLRPVCQSALSV